MVYRRYRRAYSGRRRRYRRRYYRRRRFFRKISQVKYESRLPENIQVGDFRSTLVPSNEEGTNGIQGEIRNITAMLPKQNGEDPFDQINRFKSIWLRVNMYFTALQQIDQSRHVRIGFAWSNSDSVTPDTLLATPVSSLYPRLKPNSGIKWNVLTSRLYTVHNGRSTSLLLRIPVGRTYGITRDQLRKGYLYMFLYSDSVPGQQANLQVDYNLEVNQYPSLYRVLKTKANNEDVEELAERDDLQDKQVEELYSLVGTKTDQTVTDILEQQVFDRIENLYNLIEETNKKIDDQDVGQLRQQLEQLGYTVDNLNRLYGDLDADMGKIRTSVSDLQSSTEAQIATLETEIVGLGVGLAASVSKAEEALLLAEGAAAEATAATGAAGSAGASAATAIANSEANTIRIEATDARVTGMIAQVNAIEVLAQAADAKSDSAIIKSTNAETIAASLSVLVATIETAVNEIKTRLIHILGGEDNYEMYTRVRTIPWLETNLGSAIERIDTLENAGSGIDQNTYLAPLIQGVSQNYNYRYQHIPSSTSASVKTVDTTYHDPGLLRVGHFFKQLWTLLDGLNQQYSSLSGNQHRGDMPVAQIRST